LTGVPGAGKTLVGLRLVHSHFIDDLAVPRGNGKPTAPAVFLSGNGPLVEVLQYELRHAGGGGKTFVRGVKDYVRAHSSRSRRVPSEHVLVYDEAQRAYDAAMVAAKHPEMAEHAKSEPELFVEFAEGRRRWSKHSIEFRTEAIHGSTWIKACDRICRSACTNMSPDSSLRLHCRRSARASSRHRYSRMGTICGSRGNSMLRRRIFANATQKTRMHDSDSSRPAGTEISFASAFRTTTRRPNGFAMVRGTATTSERSVGVHADICANASPNSARKVSNSMLRYSRGGPISG
jgi:hypothetical protein